MSIARPSPLRLGYQRHFMGTTPVDGGSKTTFSSSTLCCWLVDNVASSTQNRSSDVSLDVWDTVRCEVQGDHESISSGSLCPTNLFRPPKHEILWFVLTTATHWVNASRTNRRVAWHRSQEMEQRAYPGS